MKSFLSLAFIIGSVIGAHAQTQTPTSAPQPADNTRGWSLGLNAGACWNTKPTNGSKDDKSGVVGGTVGLGLYYRVNRHWEIGAAAEYKMLSIRSFDRLMFEDDFDPVTGTAVHDESYYHKTVYYPAIAGKLLVNYHFTPGKKLDAYAGASVGYLAILKDAANEKNSVMWKVQSGTGSFLPGVYVGANYPLSRHWSINAQLGAEAVFIGNTMTHLNVITTSGTLGVRFRF